MLNTPEELEKDWRVKRDRTTEAQRLHDELEMRLHWAKSDLMAKNRDEERSLARYREALGREETGS